MLDMVRTVWRSIRHKERDAEILAGERLTAEAIAKTDETFNIIRELEAFIDSAQQSREKLLESDLFPKNGRSK
jgi:hypothetical protein